jgi:hypothetical protein
MYTALSIFQIWSLESSFKLHVGAFEIVTIGENSGNIKGKKSDLLDKN